MLLSAQEVIVEHRKVGRVSGDLIQFAQCLCLIVSAWSFPVDESVAPPAPLLVSILFLDYSLMGQPSGSQTLQPPVKPISLAHLQIFLGTPGLGSAILYKDRQESLLSS